MNEKDIVPSGFSCRTIRRRVQNSVAESMDQLKCSSCVPIHAESEAALSEMHDEVVVPESDLADCAGDESEYISSESVIDTDGSGDVTGCSATMDYDSPGSDSVDDPDDDDPLISSTAPVLLIVALTEWALRHRITRLALRSLLVILKPYHAELPLDPRTLLKTPVRYAFKNISGGRGQYYHFGISMGIQLHKCPQGPGPLLLQFNVDGLPLFKSCSMELWPILCYVKQSQLEPFVVGLYCGKRKPVDIFEYLDDFVKDLSKLLSDGITEDEVHRDIIIDCFVCDAPARAYVKNVKSFSGYYGCDKCTQEGEYLEGKVTFPLTSAPLRTDADFNTKANEEHHNGPTPLSSLNFGLVSGFAIDYMHLVCLGVVRRMLNFWLRGPIHKDNGRAGRLPAGTIATVSERLQSFCAAVPCEFARKPRALNELDRWKATEYRQLLLYTGPVVFCGILSAKVYSHFMLLFTGISLLCHPVHCYEYNQYAHELLTAFVEQSAEIYGRGFLVYNVHCLVHLAADVLLHGSLDDFSAFRFENYLRQLKQMVRKADLPQPQIVRRLGERRAAEMRPSHTSDLCTISVSGQHNNGPLPGDFVGAKQFSRLTGAGMVIGVNERDCCILTDSAKPHLVQNILVHNDSHFLVCRSFSRVDDLFLHPLASSSLGIYRVSKLRNSLSVHPLTENVQKCVCLPMSAVSSRSKRLPEFAVLPLLHTSH